MNWRIIGIIMGIVLVFSGFLVLTSEVRSAHEISVSGIGGGQRVNHYEYPIARILGLIEAGTIIVDLTYEGSVQYAVNSQYLTVILAAPSVSGTATATITALTDDGCTTTVAQTSGTTNTAAGFFHRAQIGLAVRKAQCSGIITIIFNAASTEIFRTVVPFTIIPAPMSAFSFQPELDEIEVDSGIRICSFLNPPSGSSGMATITKPSGTVFTVATDTDFCWSFKVDEEGLWSFTIPAMVNRVSSTAMASFFVKESRNEFEVLTGITILEFLVLMIVFCVGLIIWHRSTDSIARISMAVLVAFIGLVWLYLWMEVHWNGWMFMSQFNFLVAIYMLIALGIEWMQGRKLNAGE
jgi:hypothetical protein